MCTSALKSLGVFLSNADCFSTQASNDVAFLSSRIDIPTTADTEGCRPLPSSSSSTCCHPGVNAREEANGEDTREKELKTGKRWTAEGIRSLEDEDGRSLLHVAAAAGHLEAVELFLRAGVDLLKADEVGRPFHSNARHASIYPGRRHACRFCTNGRANVYLTVRTFISRSVQTYRWACTTC